MILSQPIDLTPAWLGRAMECRTHAARYPAANFETRRDALSAAACTDVIAFDGLPLFSMKSRPDLDASVPLAEAEEQPSSGAESSSNQATVPLPDEPQPDLAGEPVATPVFDPVIPFARGGLKLSGGYSTIERFRLRGELSRNFKSGREIAAVVSWSKLRTRAGLSFSSPVGFWARTAVAGEVFAERQRAIGFFDKDTSPFERRSAGVLLNIRHTLTRSVKFEMQLRLAREQIRLTDTTAPCSADLLSGIVCDQVGKGTRATATFAIDVDRRDNAVAPNRGFRLRLSQEVAAWRGPVQYFKSEASFERYLAYGDDWTIGAAVEGGAIYNVGARGAPLFERYFVGGPTLQGFDLRGVSPRIKPSSPAATQTPAVGGRYYYAARLELIGRAGGVLGRDNLRPSLFVEAASAFGFERGRLLAGEQVLGDSKSPRVSIGIGVRLLTPAGVARFDIALPVIKRAGDRTRIFSFSLGL
jgi:outer membrane protein assembly factor BamA